MLLANSLFALLYLLTGGLQGGGLGAFADAFYYSLPTITTVGSSVSHPVTHAANLVASAGAMVGMTAFAVLAAVRYARLSRPTARILFSRVAAIGMHDGRRSLALRCANRRYNHILEARATVTLVRNETTAEGTRVGTFHQWPLVNDRNAVFALPWAVIHPIDSNSPLHGRTAKDLAATDVEILVVPTGIDDAFAQAVHSRHPHVAADLRFDARLVDAMAKSRDGRLPIDLRRFHDVQRLEKT
jgi:inward rectifier potassium channel